MELATTTTTFYQHYYHFFKLYEYALVFIFRMIQQMTYYKIILCIMYIDNAFKTKWQTCCPISQC